MSTIQQPTRPEPIIDIEKAHADMSYRDAMRHRCETDHFFLGRVMGLNPFIEETHRAVANFYFPKNKNLPIAEQHPIKRRMQLDPRDTAKTTFGRVDSVQWVCAFPETVTILNATATQALGAAISLSIATNFWRPKGSIEKPLHALYPELVCTKEPFKGYDTHWNTNNHNELDIDRTIAFTSPYSTQSGWHPWIMNPDDMVETNNSGIRATHERREGVISTYETNKNAVRAGGYINMRGTRYHPFELYGKVLNALDIENPEASGWKLLIRSAVIVRNSLERLEPGKFPSPDEVILPFEKMGLTYNVLRQKFLDDYESFMCQQQNDPLGGMVPIVSEARWTTSTLTPERVPTHRDGETYICWRLPWGMKKETSYLEGACVRVTDGRVYVVDCWQSTYIPSRIAEHIVTICKQQRPDAVLLLDTPGAEAMWPAIKTEAARKNIGMPLRWANWSEDGIQRAQQFKTMEPMMKSGRLLFSTGMTKGSECHRQFVNFGLVQETGIAECVQALTGMAPMSAIRASLEEEEMELQQRTWERGMYESQMAQLMSGGRTVVDEQVKKRAAAHVAAIQSTTTMTRMGFPPLPGGLDG
jgi:hypothetical protein